MSSGSQQHVWRDDLKYHSFHPKYPHFQPRKSTKTLCVLLCQHYGNLCSAFQVYLRIFSDYEANGNKYFDVLLTVLLSIILVINQPNAQILVSK